MGIMPILRTLNVVKGTKNLDYAFVQIVPFRVIFLN